MKAARCYVGLAATLHDPALAIVGGGGELLFAEAAERPLQDKRAFNCPPDHLLRTAAIVREHCPPGAEIVAAVGWSRGLLDRLRLAAVCEAQPFRSLLGTLPARLQARRDPLLWPLADARSLFTAMTSSLTQAATNLRWAGVLRRDAEPRYYEHHLAHAAAGCVTSPFAEAACAVVDAFGEWTSTSFFHYAAGRLRRIAPRRPWRVGTRASLGAFYAMVCALCGFDPLRGEEWKVMGLAPYGRVDEPLYRLMRPLLRVDGLELLRGCSAAEYRARVDAIGAHRRADDAPPLAAADLARTGQEVFADVMRELLMNLHALGVSDNLVLAGGCALNSAWNGRICSETPFRALHVPCAPADDGNALGAALLAYLDDHPDRPPLGPTTPFLGSRASAPVVEALAGSGLAITHLPTTIADVAADLLARGRTVGWMQGRAEFGPRALGHRSILADPRDPTMPERMNRTVKFREQFRPYAPAILHEHGPEWFEAYEESPYMERALRFHPRVRDRVPAVVHVDGTGRVQSVRAAWCSRFHALLAAFHARTGIPMLLNTSFNVMGKPMIHSVEDAVAAFATTALDALVIEDRLVVKPGRA